MLLGLVKLDLSQVASHQECRLGIWYYGELPLEMKNSPAFQALGEPHQDVHRYAKEAVQQYGDGNHTGAQESLEKLQQASDRVIALLSELEREL